MRAAILFFAVWAGACTTEVNAIEDTKPCADGAFHSDGSPILLGEACYDEWVLAVAEPLDAMAAAIDTVLPFCIALAEARGMPDTWSALETPEDKAIAACASLEGIELSPEWGCELSASGCSFSFTCTTDMPPVWLDELAVALPAMGTACCEIHDQISLLSTRVFTPCGEERPPGVGECEVQLKPWLADLVGKSAALCGGIQAQPAAE